MQVEFADAWKSIRKCRWTFQFPFALLLYKLQYTQMCTEVSWLMDLSLCLSLFVLICIGLMCNVQVLSDTHISLPIWESWRFNFRRRRKCVADTEAPGVSVPLIQFSECVWACSSNLMLYSIACLWHQCVCLFVRVDVAMENKGRGEKAPPCGQKWKCFVISSALYVRPCVNTFNYLACCLSVCGIILTGIVIESLCQYWSTCSGSCPLLHSDQSQTPSSLVNWLTNLGYPWLTIKTDSSLIP